VLFESGAEGICARMKRKLGRDPVFLPPSSRKKRKIEYLANREVLIHYPIQQYEIIGKWSETSITTLKGITHQTV
jgi:hypothetical protein